MDNNNNSNCIAYSGGKKLTRIICDHDASRDIVTKTRTGSLGGMFLILVVNLFLWRQAPTRFIDGVCFCFCLPPPAAPRHSTSRAQVEEEDERDNNQPVDPQSVYAGQSQSQSQSVSQSRCNGRHFRFFFFSCCNFGVRPLLLSRAKCLFISLRSFSSGRNETGNSPPLPGRPSWTLRSKKSFLEGFVVILRVDSLQIADYSLLCIIIINIIQETRRMSSSPTLVIDKSLG